MLGYTGLLGLEERSRQIRGRQLFKMLVMLLFHFHELCCNPQDQPARFTESQLALPSTLHCIWTARISRLEMHYSFSLFFSVRKQDFELYQAGGLKRSRIHLMRLVASRLMAL